MTRGDVVLSVRDIHHRYGEDETAFVALHDVSMDVHAGEILLLMGPSGSGKTTLIQIMGCLLHPTSGQVILDGRDVTGNSVEAKNRLRLDNFGFVFQANNLFSMLTATENVMVALELSGVKGKVARERSRDLLTSVGLGDRLDAFPVKLSGGQRQRVGIARALARNPKILLADEPTAALDAESGHRVMQLMRDLAYAGGRAVVIVTHDTRIVDLADRIMRLEDGRVLSGLVKDFPSPKCERAPGPI